MTQSDLLVLGAGPAGSTIAGLAARAGAKVVVLEREQFPRDKVCGEFLSAEGCAVLNRIGLLDSLTNRGGMAIDGCLIADGRGRTATSPFPDVPQFGRTALGISRAMLDASLATWASSLGADLRDATHASRPIVEDGRVRGVVARPVDSRGGHEEYRATLVIAADGRRSMLQRALHPGIGDPQRTDPHSWFGLQAHLPDVTSGLDRRVELYVFDGGYAGLGPVEGVRLNLALIVRVGALRAAGGTPDDLLRNRLRGNPAFAARLGASVPVNGWKTVGPLRFNVRRPASHGAMFLGDAAGTIDPFAGEGMSNALRGAEHALPFALQAIERGGLTNAAARAWDRAWRRAFVPVTRRAGWIGELLKRPSAAAVAMTIFRLPAGARVLPRVVAATRTG